MTAGRALLFGLAGVALVVWPTFAAMQEAKEATGAASIWTLPLGAHAAELPVNVFIDLACGTNGGPPSLALKQWTEFRRCAPEPDSGLY